MGVRPPPTDAGSNPVGGVIDVVTLTTGTIDPVRDPTTPVWDRLTSLRGRLTPFIICQALSNRTRPGGYNLLTRYGKWANDAFSGGSSG